MGKIEFDPNAWKMDGVFREASLKERYMVFNAVIEAISAIDNLNKAISQLEQNHSSMDLARFKALCKKTLISGVSNQ